MPMSSLTPLPTFLGTADLLESSSVQSRRHYVLSFFLLPLPPLLLSVQQAPLSWLFFKGPYFLFVSHPPPCPWTTSFSHVSWSLPRLAPRPPSCCLKVPKHGSSLNQRIVLLPRHAFSGIPSKRKPSACPHVCPRTSQQGFCICCSSCFSKSASLHLHIHPKSCLPHTLSQLVFCPQLHPSCPSSTNSPCGFKKKTLFILLLLPFESSGRAG